jgi:hypothetical protein
MSAFSTGYYIGAFAFIGTMALIFWFVGRWGWIGLIIRVMVGGLVILKVLSMLAYQPTS